MFTVQATAAAQNDRPARTEISTSRRVLLIALGMFFLIIAIVGVLLPGIPTTGPLLAASYFLVRGNPAMERRLIRNRFFAPYSKYLDTNTAIPFRARATALSAMWASILVSSLCLLYRLERPGWIVLPILFAGLVGTVCIVGLRNPYFRKAS